MAVVLGISSGFVTVAPVANPSAPTWLFVDYRAWVTRDTSPATAGKITEIGWWCRNATQAANFEVGLYAADGAVVPGEAGTLLEVDRTNAKGTTVGWKRVSVDWPISGNTEYWLGVQLDDTATTTYADTNTATGPGMDVIYPKTSLPNPFGGGAIYDTSGMLALYAVWEEAVGTNIQINIGDTWKDVDLIKINIGDVWKDVAGIKQNIGDVWKDVF